VGGELDSQAGPGRRQLQNSLEESRADQQQRTDAQPDVPDLTVAANSEADDAMLRLANEFATVEVACDHRGNGPRLMIRDIRSGRCVFLDPLELAALVWARHEDLLVFLDPARFERFGSTPE
jgi:hypothetical protein